MRGLSYALVLLIGGLVGFYFTDSHHKGVIQQIRIDQSVAEKKREAEIRQETSEWEKVRDELLARPPTVIDRRVFVEGKCPVRTVSGDTKLDDEGAAAQLELAPRIVQNLGRLGDEKEKSYQECYTIVKAFQSILSKK